MKYAFKLALKTDIENIFESCLVKGYGKTRYILEEEVKVKPALKKLGLYPMLFKSSDDLITFFKLNLYEEQSPADFAVLLCKLNGKVIEHDFGRIFVHPSYVRNFSKMKEALKSGEARWNIPCNGIMAEKVTPVYVTELKSFMEVWCYGRELVSTDEKFHPRLFKAGKIHA